MDWRGTVTQALGRLRRALGGPAGGEATGGEGTDSTDSTERAPRSRGSLAEDLAARRLAPSSPPLGRLAARHADFGRLQSGWQTGTANAVARLRARYDEARRTARGLEDWAERVGGRWQAPTWPLAERGELPSAPPHYDPYQNVPNPLWVTPLWQRLAWTLALASRRPPGARPAAGWEGGPGEYDSAAPPLAAVPAYPAVEESVFGQAGPPYETLDATEEARAEAAGTPAPHYLGGDFGHPPEPGAAGLAQRAAAATPSGTAVQRIEGRLAPPRTTLPARPSRSPVGESRWDDAGRPLVHPGGWRAVLALLQRTWSGLAQAGGTPLGAEPAPGERGAPAQTPRANAAVGRAGEGEVLAPADWGARQGPADEAAGAEEQWAVPPARVRTDQSDAWSEDAADRPLAMPPSLAAFAAFLARRRWWGEDKPALQPAAVAFLSTRTFASAEKAAGGWDATPGEEAALPSWWPAGTAAARAGEREAALSDPVQAALARAYPDRLVAPLVAQAASAYYFPTALLAAQRAQALLAAQSVPFTVAETAEGERPAWATAAEGAAPLASRAAHWHGVGTAKAASLVQASLRPADLALGLRAALQAQSIALSRQSGATGKGAGPDEPPDLAAAGADQQEGEGASRRGSAAGGRSRPRGPDAFAGAHAVERQLQAAGLDAARLGGDVGALAAAWAERPSATVQAWNAERSPEGAGRSGSNVEDRLLSLLGQLGTARYGTRAELALAPVGSVAREAEPPETVQLAAAPATGVEAMPGAEEQGPDLDGLARDVYLLVRERLAVERERMGGQA